MGRERYYCGWVSEAEYAQREAFDEALGDQWEPHGWGPRDLKALKVKVTRAASSAAGEVITHD
jgi:hypothetical protein